MTNHPFMALALPALIVSLAVGCVGSELSVPADHPGHPGARTGRLQTTAPLVEDFPGEPEGAAEQAPGHVHDHDAKPAPEHPPTPDHAHDHGAQPVPEKGAK